MPDPVVTTIQGSSPPPTEAPKTPLEKLADQYDITGLESQFNDDLKMEAPSPVAPGKGSAAVSPLPPPASAAPEPKKHSHSGMVTRLATDFGFTQAEIDATEPAVLEDRVYWLNRERMANAQQNRANDTAQRAVDHKPTPPVAEDKLDFGGKTYKDAEGKDIPLGEDDLHPGLAHVLREQQKAIKQLTAKVHGFEQLEGRRQSETVTQQLDRKFQELGPDFEGHVGKDRPDPSSAEWSRRVAILNEASRLAGPGANTAAQIAKLGQAAANLFGGTVAPATVAPTIKTPRPIPPKDPVNGRFTVDQWNRGGTMPPTNREAPADLPGERRATRAVKSFLATNGRSTDEDSPGEFAALDDFPE